MAKHEMQFNDGGADWCIHCGTFDIYCGGGACEGPPTGRFDLVGSPENMLRVYGDMFGTEGLTDEGRAAYEKAKAGFDGQPAPGHAA